MSNANNTINHATTTTSPHPRGADIWVAALFVGTALTLTLHSTFRMLLFRMTAMKLSLIIVCNVFLLLIEVNTLLQVYSIALRVHNNASVVLMLKMVNDLFLIFVEPSILYLAYQRCKQEYQAYTKHKKAHYALFAFRGLTLILLFLSDLLSVRITTTQIPSFLAKTEQMFAPIPKIYYIASEIIFLRILLGRNNEFANKKGYQLIKIHCSTQAIFFRFDIFFLSTTLIYRVVYLLVSSTATIPTFYYADILSIAFTLFIITEFGLLIPQLKQNIRKSAYISNNRNSINSRDSKR
ncbi:11594_t:CDS:2 [Ambispora gerdemannii]|uniref:11594_t:CDS:1 n=1 Tax=Ambispora gerdemannii TaxID=144530 RepID=A0A9N8VJ46_9GLOM|nr:11594_t:CDS:2 [Ambispora gerdemannii]